MADGKTISKKLWKAGGIAVVRVSHDIPTIVRQLGIILFDWKMLLVVCDWKERHYTEQDNKVAVVLLPEIRAKIH